MAKTKVNFDEITLKNEKKSTIKKRRLWAHFESQEGEKETRSFYFISSDRSSTICKIMKYKIS